MGRFVRWVQERQKGCKEGEGVGDGSMSVHLQVKEQGWGRVGLAESTDPRAKKRAKKTPWEKNGPRGKKMMWQYLLS